MRRPSLVLVVTMIAGLLAGPATAESPLPGWVVDTQSPLTLRHLRDTAVVVAVEPPSSASTRPLQLIDEVHGRAAVGVLTQCRGFPNQADNDDLALRLCELEDQDRLAMVIGLRRQDGEVQRLIGSAPAADAGQLAARTLEVAALVEAGGLDGLLAADRERVAAAPGPGRAGAESSQNGIHGVYAQWLSTGASMVPRPRILFASGEVLKDMSLPPEDVDIPNPAARNPSDWGRWSIRGNEYQIAWDDGSSSSWPLDSNTFFPVHPAPPGLRLDGSFRAMTTMSVAEPQGGQLTSAAWRTLRLSPDGRFVQGEGAAAAGGNVAAYNIAPDAHGEYRIDGHSIELHFANGSVERAGFFIVAARDYAGQAPDVFGIGNTIFTRSRARSP